MSANPMQRYHSYLLRLWPAAERGRVVWRASLQNPHNGERLGFASLERLFAFLQDQTGNLAAEQEPTPSSK